MTEPRVARADLEFFSPKFVSEYEAQRGPSTENSKNGANNLRFEWPHSIASNGDAEVTGLGFDAELSEVAHRGRPEERTSDR